MRRKPGWEAHKASIGRGRAPVSRSVIDPKILAVIDSHPDASLRHILECHFGGWPFERVVAALIRRADAQRVYLPSPGRELGRILAEFEARYESLR